MYKDWVEELMQLMCVRQISLDSIEAAQRLKHRNFPESLYKFRGVDKWSLSNLRDATLHLNFAKAFNDPYDSAVDFDPCFGLTTAGRLLNRIKGVSVDMRQVVLSAEDPMLEALKLHFSQSDANGQIDEEALAKIAYELNGSFQTFATQAVTEMNRQLRRSYKICSLTERLDSLPLWAHYANNHKGFVMEYDFRSLPFESIVGLSLWPVRYSGVFNASELLLGLQTGEPFNNLFGLIAALHKSPDWKYEEEWRLVLVDSPDDPPRNFCAPLKAVYLGSDIKDSDEDLVVQAALVAGVPVFKMRLVPHEFRMEAVLYEAG